MLTLFTEDRRDKKSRMQNKFSSDRTKYKYCFSMESFQTRHFQAIMFVVTIFREEALRAGMIFHMWQWNLRVLDFDAGSRLCSKISSISTEKVAFASEDSQHISKFWVFEEKKLKVHFL